MNKTDKKTALVCGATQGIGKATAVQLAKENYRIVVFGRNTEKLIEVVDELKLISNETHQYLVADFAQPDSVKKVIEKFIAEGNQVDVLVNNTGGPKGGPLLDANPNEFLAAFNQHLICNHILAQVLVPGMKKNNWGRIINVISTSVKQVLPNLGVSNTIRGAVGNWSKTLANELGQFNITVNNVLPGATKTARLEFIASTKAEKMHTSTDTVFEEMALESPMKRLAKAEEIAYAIAFLASEKAAYINGINIPVDGGRTKSL
jgi:3-oxoacyl-[acyl-carrier protein] reductase